MHRNAAAINAPENDNIMRPRSASFPSHSMASSNVAQVVIEPISVEMGTLLASFVKSRMQP